jgi:hypothetical protein
MTVRYDPGIAASPFVWHKFRVERDGSRAPLFEDLPDPRVARAITGPVRVIFVAFVLPFLGGCVNLGNICPHKPITQGVFGEIVDSNGTLEQGVEVDIYTIVNGAQGMMFGSAQTSRGGYQFNASPSSYILCAKTVCTTVPVPTGVVESSAVDGTSGLTWDAPVAVPPDQMIGPCKFGD